MYELLEATQVLCWISEKCLNLVRDDLVHRIVNKIPDTAETRPGLFPKNLEMGPQCLALVWMFSLTVETDNYPIT